MAPHCGTDILQFNYLTRKMVGERVHSLYFWSFQKQNREEGWGWEGEAEQ